MKLDLKALLAKITGLIPQMKTFTSRSDGNGLIAFPLNMVQGNNPMRIIYVDGGYLSTPMSSGNYAYCRVTDYEGDLLRNQPVTVYYIVGGYCVSQLLQYFPRLGVA